MKARVANREALTAVLDAVFQQNSMAHWVSLLGSLIPIGPVYDIGRALENPFVAEIGMIQHVPHPVMPEQRLLANPIRINGQRLRQVVCAPLGANNAQFLETDEFKSIRDRSRSANDEEPLAVAPEGPRPQCLRIKRASDAARAWRRSCVDGQ